MLDDMVQACTSRQKLQKIKDNFSKIAHHIPKQIKRNRTFSAHCVGDHNLDLVCLLPPSGSHQKSRRRQNTHPHNKNYKNLTASTVAWTIFPPEFAMSLSAAAIAAWHAPSGAR
jgi:gamma-glutamyl:cysteine ligase YbdK (ATP-grasp superfamily)